MSKKVLNKQLDELKKKFQRLSNESIRDVKQASRAESSLKHDIHRMIQIKVTAQSKMGAKHSLSIESEKLLRKMKQKMKEVSAILLHQVNQDYQASFTLQELIEGNEGFYYQQGILEVIKKKGITEGLIQKILTQIIPAHPKDEFSPARKMKRTFYIHAGPTNSGKTYESIQALIRSQKGMYLSPLRLLALEVFEKINQEQVPCHLLTGEEEILVPGANHISCTIEKANFQDLFDIVVIDEGQMISDSQRGSAWSRAILGIQAKEIHICCSLNAVDLIQKIIEECDDVCHIVKHERQTELQVEKNPFYFPQSVKKGDALIVFSRRMALQVSSSLAQNGMNVSVIYGNLPPETRRKQVDLFLEGKTDVVVSTDAIGMGLNLPVQRVVFLETEKFDGVEFRELGTQEVKQIGGRAGRRGMYEQGFVNAIGEKDQLKEKLFAVDESLTHAYIAPSESMILDLPFGNLSERLQAWANLKRELGHFKTFDISVALELLDQAKRWEEHLSLTQLYRAIMIPFNHKEEGLLELWMLYLDGLKQQVSELPKPYLKGKDLSSLETYYKSVCLYYSFSKTFQLDKDQAWIEEERRKTSEQIHQTLKNDIHAFSLQKDVVHAKKNCLGIPSIPLVKTAMKNGPIVSDSKRTKNILTK